MTATFLFISTAGLSSQEIIVRVNNGMPYSDLVNGQWIGVNVDLYTALVEKAGFTVKYAQQPWSRGLKNLKTGKMHIMAFVTPTEKRRKFMHFIGPHAKEEIALFVHKNYFGMDYNTIDDQIALSNKVTRQIGHNINYSVTPEFDKRLKDDDKLRYVIAFHAQASDTLRMVQTDRLLGIIDTRIDIEYRLMANG